MKPKSRVRGVKSAVDILEEASCLLSASPLILAPYYIGSLPFILGLLYFWTDMSTGAMAWQHCSQAAWGLTLLFIWMKIWQSVYAYRLVAKVRGETPSPWSLRRILRVAAIQTAVQPWNMIILPVAFILLLPFPQTLAFFQNATVLGSGDEKDIRIVLQKSWRQASLWPMQNTLIIWLISPFLLVFASLFAFVLVPISSSFNPSAPVLVVMLIAALVSIPICPLAIITALNIGVALFLLPWLLKTLLDIDTLFSLSSTHLMNNTFLAVVCGLSYLCLDPLMKASYCLRCFYGESLHTGEDLKVELHSLARRGGAVVIVLALLLGPGSFGKARAEPGNASIAHPGNSVPAQQLDSAIESILRYPEYAWRMPREKPQEVEGEHGALYAFLEPIIAILGKAWKYAKDGLTRIWTFIQDLFSRILPSFPKLEKPDASWTPLSRALIIIPLVCIMALVAFLAWRAWRRRRPQPVIADIALKAAPDITREDLDARELPEEGWLNLARELMERGELRLTLRALYLATLAFLARQELITIARHKSDREYELELRRRSHTRPHLLGAFAENRALFENAWYGLHEVTPGIMERFSRNQESIRVHAER
jgi:hypothetical protein